MVAIRLKRIGTKKRPVYRVVVSDSRRRPEGRSLDELGVYDPRGNPSFVRLDRERLDGWIRQGAQPSETVRSLLKRN